MCGKGRPSLVLKLAPLICSEELGLSGLTSEEAGEKYLSETGAQQCTLLLLGSGVGDGTV